MSSGEQNSPPTLLNSITGSGDGGTRRLTAPSEPLPSPLSWCNPLPDCNPLPEVRLPPASSLVFTADVTYRKGKDTRLKQIVDETVQGASDVEHVIALKRAAGDTPWTPGRDISWDDFLTRGSGSPAATFQWKPTNRHSSSPPLAPLHPRSSHPHPCGYQVHIPSGQVALCSKANRCVVVHVRYRLDRRSQLHRLRAVDRRRHHGRL